MTAWKEITLTTISACWVKSCVLSFKYESILRSEAEKAEWNKQLQIQQNKEQAIEATIQGLADQHCIQLAMHIELFLNSAEEEVKDNAENLLLAIAISYVKGNECNHETDKEDIILSQIKNNEAIQLMQHLQLYKKQQKKGNSTMVQCLNHFETVVRSWQVQRYNMQSDISRYFE